jgi:hypothetical protein
MLFFVNGFSKFFVNFLPPNACLPLDGHWRGENQGDPLADGALDAPVGNLLDCNYSVACGG